MRHVRIPNRERIRRSEVVKVVDNTAGPLDPYVAALLHLEQFKQIMLDSDIEMDKKDLAAIKRSITLIEKRLNHDETKD